MYLSLSLIFEILISNGLFGRQRKLNKSILKIQRIHFQENHWFTDFNSHFSTFQEATISGTRKKMGYH